MASCIWAVGLHGVVACLASRIFRRVRFSHGPVKNNGLWLNLVERCIRDAEVVGSSPVNPMMYFDKLYSPVAQLVERMTVNH